MRRLLWASFLLGTTALVPTPAHADPITGFIGALVTSLGATSLGGAIAGITGGFSAAGFAAGTAFATSTLGGLVLKATLAIGFSYLAAKLAPRPPTPQPAQRIANARQPISWMEVVYGLVRKGGPIALWKAKDGRRYYDAILAAHECDGAQGHFLDEREVTLDADGVVEGNIYDGNVVVKPFFGAAGQVAAAILIAAFPGQYTTAHDMAGLTHTVVVARNVAQSKFAEVYPSGREPVYSELLRGKKVYDPRDATQTESVRSTYKWSRNAALIIADWIVSPDGLGQKVDWAKVAAEANASDEEVTDRNGNTLARWQLSGTYNLSTDRETTRAEMGAACDAFFYEDEAGQVGFHVGRWIEPDVTIEDQDILSVRYSEGQAGTDITNAMVVEYTEPAQGYREAPAAAYIVDAPDEPYSEGGVQAFWIPNHNQAVRIERRLLQVARAKYRLSQTLKYQGARLRKKRFFRQRHVEAGMDCYFEIDKLARNEDGITWSVEAHSVEGPGDFAFNAATEEPPQPKRTDIEVDKSIPAPANVTAVSVPVAGTVAIRAASDALARDSLLAQVRYRIHSPAGEWTQVTLPSGQTAQLLLGVSDNETYDAQMRAVTATGKASKWVPNNDGNQDEPTLTVKAVLNPTAPTALVSLSSTTGDANLGRAVFTFKTGNDRNTKTVKLARVATGASFNPLTATYLANPVEVDANNTYSYTDGLAAAPTNLFTNGDFGSAAGWTLQSGWSIASNVAIHTATAASSILQSPSLAAGSNYRVKFEIVSISGGTVQPQINGGSTVFGAARSAIGTWTATLTAPASPTAIGFLGSAAFAGSVDNVIAYLETASAAPQGAYDYYAVPFNGSGVPGPAFGPVSVTII